LIVPWGTFIPILIFLHCFAFELRARTGLTDGRSDRRKSKSRNAAYRTAGAAAFSCRPLHYEDTSDKTVKNDAADIYYAFLLALYEHSYNV